MEFYGVTMMSLESSAKKESIPAISYALEVISKEVTDKLALDTTIKVSPLFEQVRQALTYALENVYTEDVWNEYLYRAGLEGKSKKEAEAFINACGALFVTTILYPLFTECANVAGRFRARNILRHYAGCADNVMDTAEELLQKYHYCDPRYSYEQFEQEYPNVIASLLESLQ